MRDRQSCQIDVVDHREGLTETHHWILAELAIDNLGMCEA